MQIPDRSRRAVATWLFMVAALVFIMVVVGGITRLTESGLSMTDWHPVTGWLPPIGEAAWLAEFEKYKAFPEYQKINRGMSLEDFQMIFAWEYGHRLLGRIIGLAFFLPMAFFMISGAIRRREIPWFLFLLVAGGSQGALGWFMVQSGLVDRPDVSQYRLAAHLTLAFVIYALLLLTAWRVREGNSGRAAVVAMRGPATVLAGLVLLQIVIGAFVAGINAGHIYNTWPMMDGALIPDALFATSPAWLALFEDHLTVQFMHRLGAYLLIIVAVLVMLRGRRIGGRVKPAAMGTLHAILLQVLLGIATLVMVVPVWIGALHQATALVVWTAALWLARLAWSGARSGASEAAVPAD
ncbi:MAG: COX15/CtaA family protein [Minwuia sp.]|nr:COX15/CtaA family protein [Minwuia sp.]